MLNAEEIEVFKAFFPPGYSIYKKHKTITIPKNLIRILIIVMIVIIMIIIIIIIIIIILLVILIIRSNDQRSKEKYRRDTYLGLSI